MKIIFFLIVAAILSVSCNTRLKNENFEEFYEKFLTDSLFQISRIKFPLPGENLGSSDRIPSDIAEEYGIEVEKEEKAYYWERDSWVPFEKVDYDTTIFTEERLTVNDTIKIRIYIKDSGFQVGAHYKIIENKWYLVYYYEYNY